MSAAFAATGSALADDVLAGFRRAAEAVAEARGAIEEAALRAAELFEVGGSLVYVGAGASGLIAALDAAELPGTFGLDRSRVVSLIAGGVERPFDIDIAAEDDEAAAALDFAALGPLEGCIVVAVSASGATPYTVAVARAAREAGAYLIAVASRAASPLIELAASRIVLATGEEALRGSTRLAAGTAQKSALGLFSTLFGEALGHIHQGRMVNLRAENDKLRRRALTIISDVSEVDERRAKAALVSAEGDVKQAILICKGARDASDAARRLRATRGRLAPALAALSDER